MLGSPPPPDPMPSSIEQSDAHGHASLAHLNERRRSIIQDSSFSLIIIHLVVEYQQAPMKACAVQSVGLERRHHLVAGEIDCGDTQVLIEDIRLRLVFGEDNGLAGCLQTGHSGGHFQRFGVDH